MAEDVTLDRVVEVATRLFAGLGYDVTSTDLIAEAVGVPPSTVVDLTGGKRALYLKVMERLFEAKYAAVQAAADAAPDARTAVHRIADAYLDFYAAHPDYLALWTYRWMSDAAEIADMEDHYLRPLLHLGARRIREVVPEDVGAYPLLGVIMWTCNGFLGSGVLAPERGMLRADDPRTLEFFRGLLHLVIDRILNGAETR